jgi:hypothetical protein
MIRITKFSRNKIFMMSVSYDLNRFLLEIYDRRNNETIVYQQDCKPDVILEIASVYSIKLTSSELDDLLRIEKKYTCQDCMKIPSDF